MTSYLRTTLPILFITIFIICSLPAISQPSEYVINKKNGRIILAYKAFEDYLDSEKIWDNYVETVLSPIPEMEYLHKRRLYWGAIDSLKFPKEVEQFKKEDFQYFLKPGIDKYFVNLYDSIISVANQIIELSEYDSANLCLFLPYNSCFMLPEEGENTIFISLRIEQKMIPLIIAHEYGHCLHFQLRPEEKLTLQREVINEGMAVYLSQLFLKNSSIREIIPFMPESTVDWCMENEKLVGDSIYNDLKMTGDALYAKYISDGSFASPPEGFPAKTAYFTGYRIIEKCVAKNIPVTELCSMSSEEVIELSGYFDR